MSTKKQTGSFFAEISASIATISILALIATNYVDSQAGRAQVTEAFVLMQPLVGHVNQFYAVHGRLGNPTANYPDIKVHEKSEDGKTYAGRYVKEVRTYRGGVVRATMNDQFSDASGDLVGKVGNVQTAIQGKSIFLIPFRIGMTAGNDIADRTSLKWGCATDINANPTTGGTIDPISDTEINEQYYYAPGCVVINDAQVECLIGNNPQCILGQANKEPKYWGEKSIKDLVTPQT